MDNSKSKTETVQTNEHSNKVSDHSVTRQQSDLANEIMNDDMVHIRLGDIKKDKNLTEEDKSKVEK
ncbi:unnamed protein product, partial [Didymodactylos carnosus]